MTVQRRRPVEGVPRARQVNRQGAEDTPNTPGMPGEPTDEQSTPRARSRGTARASSRAGRPSPSVEPSVENTGPSPDDEWTDNQDTEAAEAQGYLDEDDLDPDDLDPDMWAPDDLDEQIQEELAEEFENIRDAKDFGRERTTRRSRSMPDSGIVPPGSGPDGGMHTMDGQPAIPVSDTVTGEDTSGGGLPPVQAKYRRNMDPSQIYRGRSRLALIRDLAMGEWSDSSIAQSIGVPYDVIVDFRQTYETEINEVKLALASQLAIESAGMWISKRQNRIAEMQEDYEDIDLVLAVMRENTKIHLQVGMDGSDSQIKGDVFDTNMLLGSRRHQNLLRSKLAILKAVSDELSPRNKDDDSKDESSSIRYVIEQDGGSDDIIGSLT